MKKQILDDNENWNLEVKFHGKNICLIGRLPSEKRNLLKLTILIK